MTFVDLLELTRTSEEKRRFYLRSIYLTLAFVTIVTVVQFSAIFSKEDLRKLVDFDDFYIVSKLVWQHGVEKAYHFATMVKLQNPTSQSRNFMPWTYPPQFDVLVAPFSLLPLWLSYTIFSVTTMIAYFAVLKRIALENFVLILILTFPAIVVDIRCGQNGFLTGALIGLTCLFLSGARATLAGVPLGMMVIKPHLAVTMAFYTMLNRNWGTFLVAAIIVLASTVAATAILGSGVWAAFFDSIGEARKFLELGFYPLFRMVSPYAAVKSFGFSATIALAAQFLSVIYVLYLVVGSSRRLPQKQSLGLAAISSLLISPYAYDYDLQIFGIGLALLLTDVIRLGSNRERLILYISCIFICASGLAQSVLWSGPYSPASMPPSLSGIVLVAILWLMARILKRGEERSGLETGAFPWRTETNLRPGT